MNLIRLIFGLALIAVAAYVAYTMVTLYLASTKPGWYRVWDAAYGSATKVWAKFCIVVAGIVGNIDAVADFFNMPEFKNFIDTWIGNPKVLALVVLGISLMTISARNRAPTPTKFASMDAPPKSGG